jgi:DNA-binding response OmpR family regulator
MNDSIKKVLIVEDDLSQRQALRDKFTKEGFTVLEAQNGEQGLEVAFKSLPDAIVLDVMMPKMDGLEMAKRLRIDEWGKKVPAVILSNAGDIEKIQQALENHIFEYFVKSDTKIETIVAQVKKMVGIK